MIERYTRPRMGEIWTREYRFKKMLDVEILACEAQSLLGIIPGQAVKAIKERAKFDVSRIDEIEAEVHHDVIAFLTSVAENVGEESRYIHLGLTSSDVLDTALSAQMREAGQLIEKDVQELLGVLREKAKEHKETVMVGRTHGIHAEPMTFGLKLCLWYSEMKRNLDRLGRAVENISYGKLSGAVGTFAHLDPFVEEYTCEKLSLKPAPVSTQVIQRDRHAEYLSTLAIIGASLEKFALEIRALQRTEIAEAEESFGPKQKGSSAMPHKKNPIISERICGLARLLRTNALASLENVALWHERDISHSSVERVIIPDSTILLDYMLDKFTNLIKNLIVHKDQMLKNLERSGGIIFSQKVLLELAKRGLSREMAYELVQRNALRREEATFKDALLEDEELLKVMDASEIKACFDLKESLRNVDAIFKRVGI